MTSPLYFLCQMDGGNSLYVKREDLYPLLLGGNKARIAQEYVSDMVKKRCNCMVGYGNSRSNLCRALALACVEVGVPCHIISPSDDDGTRIKTANSCIVKNTGAFVHECSKTNVADMVESVLSEIKKSGLYPYYIYGNKYGKGNEAVPVNAYFPVYQELINQAKSLGVTFDYIFLATGIGTTQAGLLCGQAQLGGNEHIVGISISRESDIAIQAVSSYCEAYCRLLKRPSVLLSSIIIDDSYTLGGYGKSNKDVEETIDHALLYASLPLDPTYTGKAFWGMKEYLRENGIHNKTILFLHTGGTPLFYDAVYGSTLQL